MLVIWVGMVMNLLYVKFSVDLELTYGRVSRIVRLLSDWGRIRL